MLIRPAGSRFWRTSPSLHYLRWSEQVAQSDQVVGDHVQTEYGTDIALPPQLELTQSAKLLDPAKDLLNAPAGKIGRAHV